MQIWKINNQIYQGDEIVDATDWGQVITLNPDLIIDLTRLATQMPKGFRQVFLNYHIKTAEMPDPQKFGLMIKTATNAMRRNMRILVYCKHGSDRSGFFIASLLRQVVKGSTGEKILKYMRAGHPGVITAQNYLDEINSWK